VFKESCCLRLVRKVLIGTARKDDPVSALTTARMYNNVTCYMVTADCCNSSLFNLAFRR